jgi:DNA-binding NtrC family response regulator
MQDSSILVIANRKSDAATLTAILDGTARVTTTTSYRGALEALGRTSFKAVICAQKLPDGNWQDVLSQIEVAFEPPRFILLAESQDSDFCTNAIKLGATDVLADPLDPRAVLEVICAACGFAPTKKPAAVATAAGFPLTARLANAG